MDKDCQPKCCDQDNCEESKEEQSTLRPVTNSSRPPKSEPPRKPSFDSHQLSPRTGATVCVSITDMTVPRVGHWPELQRTATCLGLCNGPESDRLVRVSRKVLAAVRQYATYHADRRYGSPSRPRLLVGFDRPNDFLSDDREETVHPELADIRTVRREYLGINKAPAMLASI